MKPITTLAGLVAALLFTGAALAQQPTGAGQYCIKAPSGPVKCEYQTLAQCEQAKPAGSSDQCVARSQVQGTVGGPSAPREQPPAPGQQRD